MEEGERNHIFYFLSIFPCLSFNLLQLSIPALLLDAVAETEDFNNENLDLHYNYSKTLSIRVKIKKNCIVARTLSSSSFVTSSSARISAMVSPYQRSIEQNT